MKRKNALINCIKLVLLNELQQMGNSIVKMPFGFRRIFIPNEIIHIRHMS